MIFVLGSRWNSWFWTSWWRRGAWLCWLMVHAFGTIRDGERWEERMLLKETNVAAESCAACHKCNLSFIFCRGILTGLRRPSTEQDLHRFTRRCCIRFGCHTHTLTLRHMYAFLAVAKWAGWSKHYGAELKMWLVQRNDSAPQLFPARRRVPPLPLKRR